ncbi:ATP-grasp domain-containing protein [Sinorhizobium meliloti]|nr:ATP-grasp domain-containing protein [Sinorhizobium meliloti]MDX0353383.1 ATP-grasp domain-containing protein [Sinorhizobium meliloti]
MALEISFVFGGISTEYDGSVTSFTNIISSYLALPHAERPFSVKHLYHISRVDGLVRTIPFNTIRTIADLDPYISETSTIPGCTLLSTFEAIGSRNEYVVNLLHGQFGEDGGIQTLAALSGVTGSFGDPHVASLTMNKYAMSAFVSSLLPAERIRVPKTTLITPRNVDQLINIARSLDRPFVVKPNSLGSSLFAQLFDDPISSNEEIHTLLRKIFTYDTAAVIQEFIPGDEYTCGCLISSSEVIPLPIVKLEADNEFCGRDQKYSKNVAKKSVVNRNDEISERIQNIATSIASSIDLYNMARFDFRVSAEDEIWFLECNYIPGTAKNGSFEKMLNSYGMTVVDLISWITSNSKTFKKPSHYIMYERI